MNLQEKEKDDRRKISRDANRRKQPEMRINEEKNREKDEKREKLRQMKIDETRDKTNRYSEFGEEERWE